MHQAILAFLAARPVLASFGQGKMTYRAKPPGFEQRLDHQPAGRPQGAAASVSTTGRTKF